MEKKRASALIGAVAIFGILSFPQISFAEDDENEHTESPHPTSSPHWTPKPSPSPSATRTFAPKPPKPEPSESPSVAENDDDDHDGDEAGGHDDSHDISTPPLLIRPQLPPTSPGAQVTQGSAPVKGRGDGNFYSAPLGYYLGERFHPDLTEDVAAGVTKFDATSNPPVIENIVYSSYSTPAEEFMAKSYVGIGVLSVAAGVMTIVVLRRSRNKQSYFETE